MDKKIYMRDSINPKDSTSIKTVEPLNKEKKDTVNPFNGETIFKTIRTNVKFVDDATGKTLHEAPNKTVIAGSALVAMKLFGFDRSALNKQPTYDVALNLNNKATGNTYPTIEITDANDDVLGSIQDETQRKICGFCVGIGGAGLDISDVFDVGYTSWIEPDNIVPFRYPLANVDDVSEDIYKGRGSLDIQGYERNPYYFKTFTNKPEIIQNFCYANGAYSGEIESNNVYADSRATAQTIVELHLKITRDDCREFFTTHTGLENCKINQLSLVSAWTKNVEVTKIVNGNTVTDEYEYFQDIRPFSVINFPNEILSDIEKSISIIYTLYF